LPPPRAAKIIPRIFRIMVGAACRQSAFHAWHNSSRHVLWLCKRNAMPSIAATCRWLLLLLSPLLSAPAEKGSPLPRSSLSWSLTFGWPQK